MLLRIAQIAILSIAVAAPSFAAHPVLDAHGLPGDTPLDDLYLLRGAGDAAALDGATVLSTRDGAAVVRLARVAVARLRLEGWSAVPLKEPSRPHAAKAARVWDPVTEVDPLIQSWVDAIDWISITADMDVVMQVPTRHSYQPGCEEAADSLVAFFGRLGLSTVKHKFPLSYTETAYNVCGTKTGTTYPDSVFVMCAHYDAISETASTFTPGADDNASGVAAVLAAARFMAQVPTEYTVKFTLFGGEEQGLIGSGYWTDAHVNAGTAIVGALNFDMIGWWEEGARRDLEVEVDPDSEWLGRATLNAADLYVPDMDCLLHIDAGAWWGDHASFWEDGFHAVNHEESWDWGDPDFNPNYHTTDDLIANMDEQFAVDNVRIAVATVALLVRPSAVVSTPSETPTAVRLSAWPNPAAGRVTVAVSGPATKTGTPAAVQVVDLRGRVVDRLETTPDADGGSAVWRPDPSRHPAGTYLLRLAGRPDVASVLVSIVR